MHQNAQRRPKTKKKKKKTFVSVSANTVSMVILIPSVSTERAAGVTTCTGRPARWRGIHTARQSTTQSRWNQNCRRSSSEKPTEWFCPATMGSPPSVITCKPGGRSRTIRLLETEMLAEEHAPGNHHGQREWRRKQLLLRGDTNALYDLPRHANSAS